MLRFEAAAEAIALIAPVKKLNSSITQVPPEGFRVIPEFRTAAAPRPSEMVLTEVLTRIRPLRVAAAAKA